MLISMLHSALLPILGRTLVWVALLLLLILVSLFPSQVAAAPAATTRYVVPNGNDFFNGVCSQQKPCDTIRHAVQISNAGDTIQVAAGKYPEGLDINKNLTIKGAGVDQTFINGDAITPASHGSVQIYSGTTALIQGLTIKNGNAELSNGGGVANFGTLTLKNVKVTANQALDGGGIFNQGTLTLQKVQVYGNQATNQGGGLFNNNGAAVLKQVDISNNQAPLGAAITSFGAMSLFQSLVSANIADANGGKPAIYAEAHGVFAFFLMQNVTVSGNTGVGMVSAGNAILTNVTIADNTNGQVNVGSGFIVTKNGIVSLANTIIATNHSNHNCTIYPGTMNDNGNNLYGDASCHITKASSFVAAPKLQPLAANGGFTQTQALKPASPAIDKGKNSTCASIDQRGVARPIDGNGDGNARCDIGAFEFQP